MERTKVNFFDLAAWHETDNGLQIVVLPAEFLTKCEQRLMSEQKAAEAALRRAKKSGFLPWRGKFIKSNTGQTRAAIARQIMEARAGI